MKNIAKGLTKKVSLNLELGMNMQTTSPQFPDPAGALTESKKLSFLPGQLTEDATFVQLAVVKGRPVKINI
ncbi:MAG: hypothetical protein HQ517_14290 [SAR324 cluster bacterium]|nr:hypothetical protein [SAR324 cluster bacterium]